MCRGFGGEASLFSVIAFECFEVFGLQIFLWLVRLGLFLFLFGISRIGFWFFGRRVILLFGIFLRRVFLLGVVFLFSAGLLLFWLGGLGFVFLLSGDGVFAFGSGRVVGVLLGVRGLLFAGLGLVGVRGILLRSVVLFLGFLLLRVVFLSASSFLSSFSFGSAGGSTPGAESASSVPWVDCPTATRRS